MILEIIAGFLRKKISPDWCYEGYGYNPNGRLNSITKTGSGHTPVRLSNL